MSKGGESPGDAGLRREVLAYADGLINLLGKNIGVITDTADPKARTLYSGAMLAKHDAETHTDWQSHSPPESSWPGPPVPEEKLFGAWRDNGYAHPMVIVAPAGSGKSCLLESIALRMATDLRDPKRWPLNEPLPPAVPVLVSLKYVGNESLAEYLPQAGRELAPPFPSLSQETLKQLRSEQRLVLLLDGLDEVPATQINLLRAIKLLPDRYLLTTRPGYGEDRIGDAQCQRQSLDELSEERARLYVQTYFNFFPCPKWSPTQAMDIWNRAWSTSFGRLLRRPLYLKAWCDFVHDRLQRGTTPATPESLHDLADLLLRQSIEFRPVARQQFGDDFDAELEEFIDWFGAVGRAFANEGFGELTRAELENKRVFSQKDDVERRKCERRWEQVARCCGWLIHSEATRTYWVPKVPLVEYQIGKVLANDAVRHPESPQILIQTFRRWVWQPFLHDILDYTFDVLWNGKRADTHRWADRWADALLQWVRSAEGVEKVRDEPSNHAVREDLLNPFLTSVIRWQMLRKKTSSEAAKTSFDRDAMNLGQAFRPAVELGANIRELIDRMEIEDGLILSILHGFSEKRRSMANVANMELVWSKAIKTAARRVSESGARGLVNGLMEQHRLSAGNRDSQVDWRDAIWSAAGRVRESEAAGLVKDWMEQYRLASGDGGARDAWLDAIWSAAGRVSESAAVGLVKDLIEQHRMATRQDGWQFAWLCAIKSAARRVSESAAAGFVKDWMEQRRLASDDRDAQEGWLYAISSAAGRVRQSQAAGILRDLMEQHQLSAGVRGDQQIWRRAIRSAAYRVDESEVVGIVQDLVEQCRLSAGDRAARFDWCLAIGTVASCVGGSDAVEFVKDSIEQLRSAEGDGCAQSAWRSAILSAVNCVSEAERAGLLRCLLGHRRLTAVDHGVESAWWSALWSAGGGVGESDAAAAVMGWFEKHRLAAGDHEAQFAWRKAIKSAADRLPESEAAAVVNDLIEHHWMAAHHDDTREAWHEAVGSAVSRVRESETRDTEVSFAVETCNLLLKYEMSGTAFKVAANNPHIAIVWRTVNERYPLDVEAVLRRNLVLDPTETFAPPLVKAALAETNTVARPSSDGSDNRSSSVDLISMKPAGTQTAGESIKNSAEPHSAFRRLILDDEKRFEALTRLLGDWGIRLEPADHNLLISLLALTSQQIKNERSRYYFRVTYLFQRFLLPLAQSESLEEVPLTLTALFEKLNASPGDSDLESIQGRTVADLFGNPGKARTLDAFLKGCQRSAKEFESLIRQLREYNRLDGRDAPKTENWAGLSDGN